MTFPKIAKRDGHKSSTEVTNSGVDTPVTMESPRKQLFHDYDFK